MTVMDLDDEFVKKVFCKVVQNVVTEILDFRLIQNNITDAVMQKVCLALHMDIIADRLATVVFDSQLMMCLLVRRLQPQADQVVSQALEQVQECIEMAAQDVSDMGEIR